jgi:hypothetical protein
MLSLLQLIGIFISNLYKPRRQLEVENLILRHQLNIHMRRAPHRLRLRASDRAALVWMTRLWPSLLSLSRVVQPDTILRWHQLPQLLATRTDVLSPRMIRIIGCVYRKSHPRFSGEGIG